MNKRLRKNLTQSKRILFLILIFNLVASKTLTWDAIPPQVDSSGPGFIEGIIDGYHESPGGVRTPSAKYMQNLIMAPFIVPPLIALPINVGCDVQSKIQALRIERAIKNGKDTCKLVENLRYQRHNHLFLVVKNQNLGMLGSMLAVQGYITRLNMYHDGHTPVSFACENKWDEGLELMLKNGGSPHNWPKKGGDKSNFQRLCEAGAISTLTTLCKHQKDLDPSDEAYLVTSATEPILEAVAGMYPGKYIYEKTPGKFIMMRVAA